MTNNRTKELDPALNPNSICRNIIIEIRPRDWRQRRIERVVLHSLRATAATNALSHEADIAAVQKWLGHTNVSNDPPLRPSQGAPGGQSDFQGQVLA